MTNRYQLIDIVRGLAILGVIWQHTLGPTFGADTLAFDFMGQRLYPFVLNNGQLGVNVLFLVSGFVLFQPNLTARGNILHFYAQRALRLWPLYALLLLVTFFISQPPLLYAVKTTILLMTGLHDLIEWRWMPHDELWVLWSLGVEILFSILLPLIVIACDRFGVLRICALTLAACFAYRIFADHAWYLSHPSDPNLILNAWKDNIFGRLDDFLVGMAAAHLFRSGFRPRTALIVAAVIGACAAGYMWNVILVTPRTLATSVLVSFTHLLFSVSSAILIVGLLRRQVWSAAVFFPLVLLGQCCYSIYLTHAFIIKYFQGSFDFSNLLSLAAYLSATVMVSLVLFVTVETIGIKKKPAWAQKLARNWVAKPTPEN